MLLLALLAVGCFIVYQKTKHPVYKTTVLEGEAVEEKELFVHSKDDYTKLLNTLHEERIIKDTAEFTRFATRKGLTSKLVPGRYLIKKGTSGNDLINKLTNGWQDPLRVSIDNLITKQDLAGRFGNHLMLDSIEFLELLHSQSYLNQYDLNPEEVLVIFFGDTYEFFWTITPQELFEKFWGVYEEFWTDERRKLAEQKNLTPVKSSILASIVQAEARHNEEMTRIAGVYLNRLRIGMALQADPTLKYLNRERKQRIYDKDKLIDSPYNTYKFPGLPPGPIVLPQKKAIDAVLNAEKHEYLFFVAKEDFSGYHNFSKTYEQHQKYHQLYKRELNRRGIR